MVTGLEVPTLNQLSLLPFSGGGSNYSAATIGTDGQYTNSSDFSVSSKKIVVKTSGLFLLSYNMKVSSSRGMSVSAWITTSLGEIDSISLDQTEKSLLLNKQIYICLNKNHTITFDTLESTNTSASVIVTAIKIA